MPSAVKRHVKEQGVVKASAAPRVHHVTSSPFHVHDLSTQLKPIQTQRHKNLTKPETQAQPRKDLSIQTYLLPIYDYVPHKAAVKVSKIGNL